MCNLFSMKRKITAVVQLAYTMPSNASQWPSCEKEESQTNNRVGGAFGAPILRLGRQLK